MDITKTIENISQYFSGALARIFGPTDDKYPPTGVQPFEGDPYKEGDRSDW
ncbi:isochorismate synthase [Microseira sp. BLCC-F43]|uniref:isochorismate synthase n=1 Tax=Microseira sp. BLCC-F43 TaxID=3153602 RepID=UPI0035B92F0D